MNASEKECIPRLHLIAILQARLRDALAIHPGPRHAVQIADVAAAIIAADDAMDQGHGRVERETDIGQAAVLADAARFSSRNLEFGSRVLTLGNFEDELHLAAGSAITQYA